MSDHKKYFNEYLVVYTDDDGIEQEATVSSKNKEQALTTAQMLYPNIISVSTIGEEKDFSKSNISSDISLEKKEDIGLPSGVYNPIRLYIAGGFDKHNKYVEKKIKARSEDVAKMIVEMRFPELKNVQVVEAEDFENDGSNVNDDIMNDVVEGINKRRP